MQQLIALVGLPLALLVTTTGLGLLAERLAGARLANGLLAPLGFCVATSLLLVLYKLGAGVSVAVAVLVAGTLAGLVPYRSQLRSRLSPGWPAVAALAIYALYAAPVLLSGNWTWSGYNFLNDTSVQFLLIEHLETGADVSTLPLTTGREVTRAYLDTSYPLGTHAYAATLSGLLGSRPEVIYQAFLASMAALAAMALGVLAGRTAFGVRSGALVGGLAMASNLTYNTGLQGSIKELGVIAALTTGAALAREVVAAREPVRVAALLGVALASILSVYSGAGLPYVAALLATLALVVALAYGRQALRARWLAAGATACAVALALAAPVIVSIVDFYRVATEVVGATTPRGDPLGQLAAPLALLQAGGIWLDGAYQTPISPSVTAAHVTSIGLWIVAGLALLSLVEIARRRCPEALLAIVPAVLTAAVVAPGVVPYADAKLMEIMSPSIVFAAAIGIAAIARLARPMGTALAVVLAVALGGAGMLSDAYALHESRIAPRDRMLALRDVGEHMAGRGTVLFNETEEFAKYFADAADFNGSADSITPRQVQLRAADSIFAQYFDLDLQKLSYVDSFPIIVKRRSPSSSRPPARYRLVYTNRYYEAWARGSQPRTLAHLPLQGRDRVAKRARCDDVRALAARARGSSGDLRLVAATAPTAVRMDVLHSDRSPGLLQDQAIPGAVSTAGPGHARASVSVAHAGSYRLWVRGTFPRATDVLVDGVRRATVRGANTPGQWLGDVAVTLARGMHSVEVRVPGGSAKPGDGSIVTIGPVVFVEDAPERLETLPVARWRSLCGRQLDWVELVRRG